MYGIKKLALFFVFAACSGGCLARQVAEDGVEIRRVLVALYTDQAIDNLSRAYENRMFVQLRYSALNVKDSVEGAAVSTGGNAVFTRTSLTDLTKAGVSQLTRTSTFSGIFPLNGTAERDRLMTFRADPVTDQNFVYDAYLDFCRNSTLFVASDSKPSCPVHICKKCGDKWYWVPAEAGPEFLQLVLKTSFLPSPAPPPQVYWESVVADIHPRYDEFGLPVANKYVLTLSQPVPNDKGLIQLKMDGRKTWLRSFPLDTKPFLPTKDGKKTEKQKEEPGPMLGTLTHNLFTEFDLKAIPADLFAQLPGSKILFFAEHFPNQQPKVAADPNQRIIDALENIRLQLIRPNSLVP